MKRFMILIPLLVFACIIFVIFILLGGVIIPASVGAVAEVAFWEKEDIYRWALSIPGEQYAPEGYENSGAYGRIDYLRTQAPADFVCRMSSTVLTDCYDAPRPGYPNHDGIDYGIAPDMEVITPMSGIVTYAGALGSFGNLVVIENHGYQVLLAHNNAVKVAVGEFVAAGQAVALSGSTGNSSGPHIHFEMRKCSDETGGCVPVDPLETFLPGQDSDCDWYFGKIIEVTYLSGFSYTCGGSP